MGLYKDTVEYYQRMIVSYSHISGNSLHAIVRTVAVLAGATRVAVAVGDPLDRSIRSLHQGK